MVETRTRAFAGAPGMGSGNEFSGMDTEYDRSSNSGGNSLMSVTCTTALTVDDKPPLSVAITSNG